MNEVLIISDNLEIAYNVDIRFSNAGWSNKNMSVMAMMARNSASTNHYQCIVLIVDIDLLKRFGSVIKEMSAMIRNISKQSPVYLIFEGEYDPIFSVWTQYSRQFFTLSMDGTQLPKAINKIIILESEYLPTINYCSPMDVI